MARTAQSKGVRVSPKIKKKLSEVVQLLAEQHGVHIVFGGDDPIARMMFAIVAEQTAVTHARKAVRELRERVLDWNELRLHTAREIEEMLAAARVRNPGLAASRIRRFLQVTWDTLRHLDLPRLAETKPEEIKLYIQSLLFLPPYLLEYLTVLGGLDSSPPVAPACDRVLERIGVFGAELPHADRRKLLGAVVDDALYFYHLMHEHGRKLCTEHAPRCTRCAVFEQCDHVLNEAAQRSARKRAKATRADTKKAGGGKAATKKKAAATKSGASKRASAANKTKSAAKSKSAKAGKKAAGAASASGKKKTTTKSKAGARRR